MTSTNHGNTNFGKTCAVQHFRELLISFKRATGQKPQRIIFYRCTILSISSSFFILITQLGFYPYYFVLCICRDGVSEGQFYQVLLYELDAIRKVLLFFPNFNEAQ